MKRLHQLILTGIFLAFAVNLNAQILQPKFEDAVKLDMLNSEAEESMPVPYSNGEGLYFVRTYIEGNAKERKKAQEVWGSERKDGKWSEAHSLFDYMNDLGNNGVIGSSTDGKTVYVFNSIQTRRKLAKGIAYTQLQEDGTWSDLKKLNIQGFEAGEGYYSFYMNPTENILLVSMSPSDTTIAEDLYVSLKDASGNWSALKNLGNTINTKEIELSPYIAEDGKTLYFSSTGHGGMGNADVFVSYRQDDSWTSWSKPLNLGAPVNSDGFDAYFIIGNNQEVFFTSNRGQKYSDIYTTKLAEKSVISKGEEVIAEFIYKGLPVKEVELQILNANGDVVEEVMTDENGQFKYTQIDMDEDYVVQMKDGSTSDYAGGKVYLMDTEGKRLKRLVMQGDGMFTEEAQDTELIEGVFEYNKLPMKNAGLVVLDENGYPLDTIYTDEDGKFQYYKMEYDDPFSLKPIDVEDVKLDDIDLYLTDNAGNRISDSNAKGQGDFEFSNVSGIAMKDEKPKDPEMAEKVKEEKPKSPMKEKKPNEVKSKEPTKTQASPMKGDNMVINFDFNNWLLTPKEKQKLDGVISKMANDKSLTATLTGHTDDVGTSKNNLRVSIYRVRATRAYMLENGIAQNRITIYGMGEVQPSASNDTEEGRAKNRRVEVALK